MKNWWEEDEEFDFSGKREDPFEAEKSSDDKSFEEIFGTSFNEMPLRQQIETAYDYYDKPQNGPAYQIAGEPMAFGGNGNNKLSIPEDNLRNCTGIDDIYYSHNGKMNTKDHEGGYNFARTHDAGGPTNYGISQGALDEYNSWSSPYRTGFDFPSKVKDLNNEQSKKILEEKYLKRHAVDKVCDKDLARNTFDILMSTTNKAPHFLAESVNQIKNTDFHDSDVVSDELAGYVNQNLTDEDISQINDLLTQKGMNYYFNSVDRRPTNINNINGWYNRRKSYYSNPEKFDLLYKKRLKEYLKKYGAYYDGK